MKRIVVIVLALTVAAPAFAYRGAANQGGPSYQEQQRMYQQQQMFQQMEQNRIMQEQLELQRQQNEMMRQQQEQNNYYNPMYR